MNYKQEIEKLQKRKKELRQKLKDDILKIDNKIHNLKVKRDANREKELIDRFNYDTEIANEVYLYFHSFYKNMKIKEIKKAVDNYIERAIFNDVGGKYRRITVLNSFAKGESSTDFMKKHGFRRSRAVSKLCHQNIRRKKWI